MQHEAAQFIFLGVAAGQFSGNSEKREKDHFQLMFTFGKNQFFRAMTIMSLAPEGCSNVGSNGADLKMDTIKDGSFGPAAAIAAAAAAAAAERPRQPPPRRHRHGVQVLKKRLAVFYVLDRFEPL